MQRKQQVGECWVCVIFFACVCVWVRQIRRLRLTIPCGLWFLLFLVDFAIFRFVN
jgi:hypothetical protein